MKIHVKKENRLLTNRYAHGISPRHGEVAEADQDEHSRQADPVAQRPCAVEVGIPEPLGHLLLAAAATTYSTRPLLLLVGKFRPLLPDHRLGRHEPGIEEQPEETSAATKGGDRTGTELVD